MRTLGDSAGVDALRTIAALARVPGWTPALVRWLSSERPDVIHTNGLKAHALVALARPKGVPLLWHLHDFVSSRPVMRRLLPLLRSRAALAVAVSNAVAVDARAVLGPLPVVTVLNGVRTDQFQRSDIKPADLDALAGLPPAHSGTTRAGLIATFATWKGHDLFLEAVRGLDALDARFYVIGGGLYSTTGSQLTMPQLRTRVERLGLSNRVGIVPYQQDVAPVFRALDIVVHASTRPEPFGRVVAEGMAAGRPVVAVAAGGILEQIENNRTGVLVPPNDVIALRAQLESLILSQSLREAIGQAAAQHASKFLDAQRLGMEMRAIYESLTTPP
jgi:glycosyltransferase involved in cell wall biosynthesis